MKKITTLAAGIGLAAIALTGFALPANANTAEPSASTAATERLEGPFQTFTQTGWTNRTNWVPNASTGQVDAGTADATWTFPRVSETGPIRSEDTGLCLTSSDVQYDPMLLEACDASSPQQMFTMANDGLLTSASGWSFSDSGGIVGNGPLVAESPTSLPVDRVWLNVLSPVVVVAEPVDISGPAQNEITLRNPTFTGTGDEGAEIIVTDANGVELCRATVSGGNWSCTTGIDLPDGPVDATATQTATDGTISTDTVTLIVADPLNTPVIDPMLAGGASMALLAAAGAIFAIRRKQNATAAL